MPDPELLSVPPVEAVDHFRAKGFHVGFDWRDTAAAQHLVSFTVAKAMRLDILQTIRSEVDRALAEGITFEEFSNGLEPRLRELGWWGRQRMTDPATGATRAVQLGSPRRLRIIFDTNLRMALARGRWERIERLAEARPWLRYVATLDERTRPAHRAWHGTVLPWDHPFWRTHYPPCGWRCRCTVTQLSRDDLEEFGLQPSAAPPAGWQETRPWRNGRTGKVHHVPVGIDPGFDHNVGLIKPVVSARTRLAEKIEATPPPLAAAARRRGLDDWIAEGRAERERMVEEEAGSPRGMTGDGLRRAILRRLRAERGAGEVAADVRSERGGATAARRIREAASLLPRSWVERANRAPVVARRSGSRGAYYRATPNRPAMIRLSDNPSVALH
ncbi:MAG: phage minor head protein, partial [Chloroflexota bacterium]|nr:phage minor head protein [Chloroflexota bacterium]